MIGIDLGEEKQALALVDHDVRVLWRKTVRVRAHQLGEALDLAVAAARERGLASQYTVVRVPLRRVDSDAPLVAQVQAALDLVTNRRIEWWQLADQSPATVRVVLLDGLDEMLQASQHDRAGHLQEIEEFQRHEAEQERRWW